MSKDMGKLFGEIRGLVSELANIDKNIGINKTLVLKEMSKIVMDYNPNYQEWCDIKFYIAQSVGNSFDDSHHLGCTGLLAEIFGETTRITTLSCSVEYREKGGITEVDSFDCIRTTRSRDFLSTLDNSGVQLALKIIDILTNVSHLIYNIEDPFNLKNDKNNADNVVSSVDFKNCRYIINGAGILNPSLQLLKNISREYCLVNDSIENIEDKDGLFFAVINDIVKNSIMSDNSVDKTEVVIMDKTSVYTKNFINTLFNRNDNIMDSSTICIEYLISLLFKDYINRLIDELEYYNLEHRHLEVSSLYLSFKYLDYRGIKESIKNLI